MTYPTPDDEGYFWAKLRAVENPDDASVDWEIVYVWINIQKPWCEADIETGECLGVSVPGLEGFYTVIDFVWGPRITQEPPK